jgi:hypothetical protein
MFVVAFLTMHRLFISTMGTDLVVVIAVGTSCYTSSIFVLPLRFNGRLLHLRWLLKEFLCEPLKVGPWVDICIGHDGRSAGLASARPSLFPDEISFIS